MDDIKPSRVDTEASDSFEEWLIIKDDPEKGMVIGNLKRCPGKHLDCLGMVLDFTVPKQVSFKIEPHVVSMVGKFEDLEKIKGNPDPPLYCTYSRSERMWKRRLKYFIT